MTKKLRNGLTLLETIVSLWLLFMAIVFATAVLHRILRQSKIQEQRTRAAYLAHGKMEELMLVPASELGSGLAPFEEPFSAYNWSLSVEPMEKFHGKMVTLNLTVTTPSGEEFQLTTQRKGRPDRIWFCSNNTSSRLSRLFEVSEDGTELTPVKTMSSNCNDNYPTLNPDGSMVAFISDRSRKRQLYVMPADGSEPPKRLTDHPIGVQEPSWSPNGNTIAYVAYDDGFSQIYLHNLESEKSQVISKKNQHEGAPSWSPRGDDLVFVTTNPASSGTQVAVMKADGTHRRILTKAEGWNTAPSFSPDGETIAFMSSRDGNSEIYTRHLESGQTRRLTGV
jgi:Tol biopolymer transport system component